MTEKIFMSIRETAATGILSEYALRLMEKQGRLPCIKVGVKCLINYPQLIEQLNAESKRAISGGENAQYNSLTKEGCLYGR